MSISYEQLKSGLFSDHDLAGLIQSFNPDSAEAGWTIVKYVVRSGDTINALSRRFNIPATLILRLNTLSPGATLKQGQVILLPELCP